MYDVVRKWVEPNRLQFRCATEAADEFQECLFGFCCLDNIKRSGVSDGQDVLITVEFHPRTSDKEKREILSLAPESGMP